MKTPIDYRVIAVQDTPRMAAVAKQAAELLAEYDRLREKEQRRQFAAYLRRVRENATERLQRFIETGA